MIGQGVWEHSGCFLNLTGDVMAAAAMDLLIVEDDADFRETCSRWMTRKGHRVHSAGNAHEAMALTEARTFDVAIVDMNMPGMTGIELLERMKSAQLDTEVIILTGQGTIESAVNAMKLGACDYLTKPFPLDELEQRCQLAWERCRLGKENKQLKAIIRRTQPNVPIIGDSQPMRDVFRLIDRVAPTDKPVLIQGESGTGKELVARAIQRQSARADKPFVTINCAALPEQLVESELFGHRKGAFTGANEDHTGLFEVADTGTLFIDEIGELPGSLQPKLLRALEDGSMRRVGSTRERRVNVRLIAATNCNLAEEVAEGRFREDLYYRINVMSLMLPALRERGSDIDVLVDHFLGVNWTISDMARRALNSYYWPGNIRQLRNAIERAQILADDSSISLDDLPVEVVSSGLGTASGCFPANGQKETISNPSCNSPRLEDLERAHILQILEREHGNKARAARTLGIHRRKLYRLLDRYGIRQPAQEK
jgi:DNA-binding NtrC family response regulator